MWWQQQDNTIDNKLSRVSQSLIWTLDNICPHARGNIPCNNDVVYKV